MNGGPAYASEARAAEARPANTSEVQTRPLLGPAGLRRLRASQYAAGAPTGAVVNQPAAGMRPSQVPVASIPVPPASPPIRRRPVITSSGEPDEREADFLPDTIHQKALADRVAAAPRRVSSPGDPHEQQAEQVADQVVRASPGNCGGCVSEATPCSECAESVQRVASGPQTAAAAPVIVGLGRGRPLDPSARELMEPRFGMDFGAVRIHTDADAARAADALTAEAFTTGTHIAFAAGRYAPQAVAGQRLLAHELTHVVQGVRAAVPSVQRQVGTAPPQSELDPARDDPLSDPARKGVPAGYGWFLVASPNFDSMPSSDMAARLIRDYVGATQLDACVIRFGGTLGINGWWSFIHPTRGEIGRVIGRIGEAGEPGKATTTVFDVYGVYAPPGRPGQAAGSGQSANGTSTEKSGGEKPVESGGEKGEPKDTEQQQGKPGSGSLAGAVERAKQLEGKMPAPVVPAPALLTDPAVAAFYLQILEHFSGRSITAADQAAAADGLTVAEVDQIVGFNPLRRSLTDLFTQGLAEFKQAGGTDFEQYKLLIQTVDEQFTRGNPTATLNNLKISKGIPEVDILGIVERPTNVLLYDQYGVPLPSFGGGGLMRDHGYIGSRNESQAGLNIANIQDPAIRQLLNALRQSFGDPTRMAFEAANIYFENIERVNAEVRAGLSDEVIKKFEEMIVPFTGFIAGQAVSSFLVRFPNPQVAVVGLVLKGLLTTAGYVMDIQFGAEALNRLAQAAAELIKVEKTDKGQLTKLSQSHITNAAVPIRQMVADMALMAGTRSLGGLIRLAAVGLSKLEIECTICKLDEIVGKEEEKAKENIPPEKPQVQVPGPVRGFAIEDVHLDRVGYQSLRKAGPVRGIDGIRGGDVEVVSRGGEVIRRYTRPDGVSVKSTNITDPAKLSQKVTGELGVLRGRYEYKGGGIEIDGLGQRRYDLVFEEGAFGKFTKETLSALDSLKQAAGSIVFRWYINVGGQEFYGPDYLRAQGKGLGEL